jgi:hypothetical protein
MLVICFVNAYVRLDGVGVGRNPAHGATCPLALVILYQQNEVGVAFFGFASDALNVRVKKLLFTVVSLAGILSINVGATVSLEITTPDRWGTYTVTVSEVLV